MEWTALCNRCNKMDGLELLRMVPDEEVALAFLDPQYRGLLDHLSLGKEGARQKGRAELSQMPTEMISDFLKELSRVLRPSGHLMLWIDKFHLVEGLGAWLNDLPLMPVDLVTWDKQRMGMGHRTRRQSEYLVILQKPPKRARGIWTNHRIRDVWSEAIPRYHQKAHPHAKPEGLQTALIDAVTVPGDLVLDPASGGWSVMRCCHALGRDFIGADLRG